jgi:glycosyltransferase involved in cell wall biosynthesis
MPPDDERVEPRRISLVLHKFSRGGSDRVAAYLARGFTDAGMNVDLVVFCQGGEVEGILSELVGTDIPIRYLGRSSGWRPLDLLLGLPSLARFLRRAAPDAVISTANNMSLVTALAVRLARLSGVRLILKTTNPIATARHRGLVRRIRLWSYRIIFRWTDAVWTLSADESREMRAEFTGFPTLFRDVANPYVTPRMLARPLAVEPRARAKTVISIARLAPQKRLDLLIRAFARLRDRNTQLLILGEGEDRPALIRLIEELGLQDRVAMPGYVKDVSSALRAADLFVLTSDYEGLPAALLEAMAADCRVLTTDCFPAARSMMEHCDGGAIIETTDPASLATLIELHLERPRPTSLHKVAERYSIQAGVASHLDALRALF